MTRAPSHPARSVSLDPVCLATHEQLVDLAGRSMELRVGDRHQLYAGWNEDGNGYSRVQRDHPYLVLNDGVLRNMQRLGRAYRNSGRDLRVSPFWPLLKHQDAYIEAFEYRRHVALAAMTPKSLYDHLSRGNRVTWHGWVAFGGRPHEATDDFGLPVWCRYFYFRSPAGQLLIQEGLTKAGVREAYASMTGHPFEGADELGDDPPHEAENVPAWMINADGSVATEPAVEEPCRAGSDA